MNRTAAGILPLVALVVAVACTPQEGPEAGPPVADRTPGNAMAVQCTPSPRMPVEGRASPYDSTMVVLSGQEAKICYGRPSARGRTMIGGDHVPHGQLWRTGANEPTIIHLPFAAAIAGIEVEPGSYSLYTIPDPNEWTVIVNRSTEQWGHESAYTEEVRAQEVGRATVPAQRTNEHVEMFTIRFQPAAARESGNIVLEWERTRVPIPIERR